MAYTKTKMSEWADDIALKPSDRQLVINGLKLAEQVILNNQLSDNYDPSRMAADADALDNIRKAMREIERWMKEKELPF